MGFNKKDLHYYLTYLLQKFIFVGYLFKKVYKPKNYHFKILLIQITF